MPAYFVNQTDMAPLRHDIHSLYEGNKNKLFYFFASPCLPERNHSWCYPPPPAPASSSTSPEQKVLL